MMKNNSDETKIDIIVDTASGRFKHQFTKPEIMHMVNNISYYNVSDNLPRWLSQPVSLNVTPKKRIILQKNLKKYLLDIANNKVEKIKTARETSYAELLYKSGERVILDERTLLNKQDDNVNNMQESKKYKSFKDYLIENLTTSTKKVFRGMKKNKEFAEYAKKMGFSPEKQGYREGPSKDDMFSTIMYINRDGDHVGFWQNDPEESIGILYKTPEEFTKAEEKRYEEEQKYIDDEIKAGRNPYRD